MRRHSTILMALAVGLAYAAEAQAQSVCYQVKFQATQQWSPEVCDGADAGTTGQSKLVDQFRVRSLLPRHFCYRAHNANVGWGPIVCDNNIAGTKGKYLQAVQIWTWDGDPDQSIEYQAHVADLAWMPKKYDGTMAGTTGQSRSLQALRVWVTPRRRCPDARYKFSSGFEMNALQAGRDASDVPVCTGAIGFQCGPFSWCEEKLNNDAVGPYGGWTTSMTTQAGSRIYLMLDYVNHVTQGFYCRSNGDCWNLGTGQKSFAPAPTP